MLFSRHALKTELINQINDDMAALVLIDAEGGPDILEQAIAQRIAFNTNRSGAPYYRLQREDTLLVGNIAQAPSDYTQPLTIDQNGTDLLIRGTPLRGQRVLVVGRDMNAIASSMQRLGLTMGLGALILSVVSIGLTLWHVGRLRQRTAALNTTFDKIAQGHLNARVAVQEPGDELDNLASHINGMLDRLNRLLTLRKRLTDQLAHEIRSPLARLDATLDNATDGGQASIETARKSLGNTLNLLDGLLDISALDAQAGDRRNFKPVRFDTLVAEIYDLFEPLAESEDLTLMLNAEDNIHISGDGSQLGRLVSNLFDNAIKYADHSPIIVRLTSDKNRAVLTVSNHGPEIAPTLQNEIFTPFFRHPDAPAGKGHGLGLALCRSIATRHGGTLTVTSDDGLTEFCLRVPLS